MLMLDTIMQNVYKEPMRVRLQERLPDFYLVSYFHITELQLEQTGADREFVSMFTAAITSTIDEMASYLTPYQFPVHDHHGQRTTDV